MLKQQLATSPQKMKSFIKHHLYRVPSTEKQGENRQEGWISNAKGTLVNNSLREFLQATYIID
jgi:hypothetical protein